MKCWLKCRSFPGQFSNERGVEFIDHKGNLRSMFVPANYVHGDGEGSLMEVEIASRHFDGSNDLVMLWLPAPMLEAAGSGNFVTVLNSQIVYQTETVYDV